MGFVARSADVKSISAPNEVRSVVDSAPIPAAQGLNDAHPLEARATQWRSAQEAAQMDLLRRMEGPAEPIKRATELYLLDKTTFVPSVMGGPSMLHRDVLMNNEDSLDWEDVYRDDTTETNFHRELEARMFK